MLNTGLEDVCYTSEHDVNQQIGDTNSSSNADVICPVTLFPTPVGKLLCVVGPVSAPLYTAVS